MVEIEIDDNTPMDELVRELQGNKPSTVGKAINELAKRGADAVEPLALLLPAANMEGSAMNPLSPFLAMQVFKYMTDPMAIVMLARLSDEGKIDPQTANLLAGPIRINLGDMALEIQRPCWVPHPPLDDVHALRFSIVNAACDCLLGNRPIPHGSDRDKVSFALGAGIYRTDTAILRRVQRDVSSVSP